MDGWGGIVGDVLLRCFMGDVTFRGSRVAATESISLGQSQRRLPCISHEDYSQLSSPCPGGAAENLPILC